MKLEEHLKELSYVNEEYERIYNTWKIIKEDISSVLDRVCVYFPHFSLHNASHSKSICLQIERFLGDKRIQGLSITDTIMLLLAFYLHDIGMALQYKDIKEEFQSITYQKKLEDYIEGDDRDLADVAKRLKGFEEDASNMNFDRTIKNYNNSVDVYEDVILIIESIYRGGHADRSAKVIENKVELSNFLGVRFAHLLGEICRMHQRKIEDICELPYESNGLVDDYVHPRFVAAMLCLGDLLDLDTDRFDEKNLKTATPMPNSSQVHLLKHKSIQHFLVVPTGIEIIADTESIEVYRAMRDWSEWIRITCNYLANTWIEIAPKDFGNAPYLSQCDIYIKGSRKWIGYSDLKFSISKEKAFELLQGAGIYRNKFVCIREIIQNAVDATILQVWKKRRMKELGENSKPNELTNIIWDDYLINIDIRLNENDNVEVEINDQGIGISNEDLIYMTQLGNKKNIKWKEIVHTMPDWLKPSGAFGLGIQSIFQLTDSFEVITKTDDEPAKKIIFENGSNSKGYIIVEDYNDAFHQGTKLTFTIDNNKINISDLYCSEYAFKTEKIGELILYIINRGYTNINIGPLPVNKMEKQIYEYIPVKMTIMNPLNHTQEMILEYKSLFENVDNDEDFIIKENEILCQKYDDVYMCYPKISILLDNNDTSTYGACRDYCKEQFGNTLFYKNVLVSSSILEKGYMYSTAIYDSIDFSFNLLSLRANKILKINRNSIREDFKEKFKQICNHIIEINIRGLIDKILSSKQKIKDLIITVYQFAIYYEYRYEEIEDMYKEELNKLSFNNYWSFAQEEVVYSFDEINSNSIYFIYGEFKKETEEILINQGIDDLSHKKKYCVKLNPTTHKSKNTHLIYHKVMKMFVGKIDNKVYRILEAKPLRSNKYNIECIKDKYAIIDDLVNAIYNKRRCIHVIHEYTNISTTLFSERSFSSHRQGSNKCIELPFDDYIYMTSKEMLEKEGYILNKQAFIQRIISSKRFTINVDYISKYHNKDKDDIRKEYAKFINAMVDILADASNKDYIKDYIKEELITKNRSWGYIADSYEAIEYNRYITFDI